MRKSIMILLFLTLLPSTGFLCYFLYHGARAAEASEVVAQKAQSTINDADQLIKRIDKHIDDTFLINLKNDINVSAGQSQIFINNSNAVTGQLVTLLEHLDKRAGAVLDKLPGSMDRLDASIDRLNNNTFPAITRLLNSADKSVADIDPVLVELRTRLADPNIQRLISSLATTSENAAGAMAELKLTEQEVRESLPELLSNLSKVAANHAELAGEAATFVQGLNKPVTKKQRVYRAIIQILAVGLPVAIHH